MVRKKALLLIKKYGYYEVAENICQPFQYFYLKRLWEMLHLDIIVNCN